MITIEDISPPDKCRNVMYQHWVFHVSTAERTFVAQEFLRAWARSCMSDFLYFHNRTVSVCGTRTNFDIRIYKDRDAMLFKLAFA